MTDRLYGICGPTASGKTALSIEVAKRVGGEIVSCDSMQIYKGMDILSAKPTSDEMQGIRHHLISVIDTDSPYSASRFREDASKVIEDIKSRGKIPLLCGGTGLYIDAVTRGMRFSEKSDEALRNRLKAVSEENGGPEKLHDVLRKLDPESADKYPPGDIRRVIRSIEINMLTGMTRSQLEKIDSETPDAYPCTLYMIDWPRDVLYERINKRVDQMVASGLINEVSGLMKTVEKGETTSYQAIGYKEIAEALKGNIAMRDAIINLKTATRNYAKRQLTWFRRDKRVIALNMENETLQSLAERIAEDILNPKEYSK